MRIPSSSDSARVARSRARIQRAAKPIVVVNSPTVTIAKSSAR